MDKFTKVVKVQTQEELKGQEYLYQDDYIKVKKVNDWTFVEESDRIVVLPYIKDEGYVFLRSEDVPPWKEKYKGQQRVRLHNS
jgi:hypothetical protein